MGYVAFRTAVNTVLQQTGVRPTEARLSAAQIAALQADPDVQRMARWQYDATRRPSTMLEIDGVRVVETRGQPVLITETSGPRRWVAFTGAYERPGADLEPPSWLDDSRIGIYALPEDPRPPCYTGKAANLSPDPQRADRQKWGGWGFREGAPGITAERLRARVGERLGLRRDPVTRAAATESDDPPQKST